ncbi:MAG TPA: hypothetical protein VHU84_09720 [Lacipirellulaceae bacterium]|jgi:hypothetical protein|nr:hypothetical protein [Lacipirellulaceae bacterium]
MVCPTFDDLFSPLINLPCWGVQQGYGSFVTMEFGQPHQVVYDVRTPKTGPVGNPHRVVAIRGEWHLWIYCCNWRMKYLEETLATSESSDDVIAIACSRLDGQLFTGFQSQPDEGQSQFAFDLGGVLETWPDDDEVLEQWMLYCPDGNVFTFRSDGQVNFKPGRGEGSGDETWLAAR